MSSILKKVFIGAVIFSTLTSSFADFWEDITPYRGPKRDVITLIITSNYKHPSKALDNFSMFELL